MTNDGAHAGVRPKVAVIGAGRLGTVLAISLHRADYQVVACASRSASSANRLAARIPGCTAMASPNAAATTAGLVFLTVPDDSIVAVDAEIKWQSEQIAIHCSGARPAGSLANALAAGAVTASFHPIQSFAEMELGLANLPGSAIGIETADSAWPLLSQLARDLGATPLRLTPENRGRYHAGAVLVSNGTVGLVAIAAELWRALGIERGDAVRALLPLLAGTVRNLEGLGLPGALTGAISRGNPATILTHLRALADAPRELAVYRDLSDWLIDLAQESGTINVDQAAALRFLLATPPAEGTR